MAEVVSNKQVILRDYVSGTPVESAMLITTSTIRLQLPQGSNAFLLKTSTCPPINGYGVCKVVDSGDSGFKKDELVWGLARWEEYSLITDPESHAFIKIHHTDVPFSYYTGVLGELDYVV
ncbi:NADPH-dependent oxidoreductase 2-alkenal reductase-like [Humulus lupulus]|uniref:NADPH-dependent oxidoreductase 2-alkenal reductase-like n=1 Tax=Humulus lupulus TaxID=3486 RepID=UPI002B40CDA3|nr:NADPH-dependent oxidoreductase 2-alkenal reductase-like [Humulus lupulus]